jgi:hypothetical protein
VLPRSAAALKPDAVEVALARALTEASVAGRFDIVAQLAREGKDTEPVRRLGPQAPTDDVRAVRREG